MKKFTQWVDVIREAEERKQSELQKSYKEYFEAKLNKFGAKSPADLTAEQKTEFFNEIKKDWEKGTGAKPAGKKDVEEHGVKESEEFEMNEGSIEDKIKTEAVERLSQFFRVSPGVLAKFKFDGKDDVKALSKALNSTSDEGTKHYYDTVIRMSKKDLGIRESEDVVVNEGKGDDLARTIISSARAKMKNLTDDDLFEFRKMIAEAFDLKLNESEEFELSEGVFYRLPRKMIQDELWLTTKNLQNFFNHASAGADIDPGVLDSIVKSLEKLKKEAKKFTSIEDVKGSIYEAEEVNETNISMYKSMVQNVLKDLDVEVKQSDLKVGTKKSDSWLFVTLNGHVLCSDTAYDQMVAWAKAAIKEDPAKYGLPTSLKESELFEADVKNAKDFEEYAMAILKKQHGDDFDEAKAKKTISGLSAAAEKDGDWGAAVGKLQNA